MSPATLPSALEANLAALGTSNADVAQQLRSIEPPVDLEFIDTPQGVPAARLDGTWLCSRHRPVDEAARLVDEIDLVEHAVVVVLGFGLGHHVRRLAERMGKGGVIVVFEPDLGLLRAVLERVDCSAWLGDALVVLATDPDDRGGLAERLRGADGLIGQGVEIIEHPASRARLGERSGTFCSMLGEHVTGVKTTLMTTLIRSVETVRNLLLNLDHYAGGAGIDDLRDVAAGCPAVVVSAGPSLHRNIDQLAAPGVRDRCVIIAVQTTLKPLLDAGVRPHFVTALDYHEISRRFYEDLDGHDCSDITLIADPKAHPVIIDAFPGPVRCCANGFLDRVLGPDLRREMGAVPAGATVAHLALYVARFIGADPIILVGQDLGFTDGLYYAPGTAIEDVWSPELNAFNTIEMMQWKRIARHRRFLKKMRDHRDRPIYTDDQMLTYLQQFERDFARFRREGVRVIDATEGGVARQHVEIATLADTLAAGATTPLPPLPLPSAAPDAGRLARTADRVAEVRRDIARIRQASEQTVGLIEKMLADQADQARMTRLFARLDKHRAEVESRLDAFELLNQVNQLGVFNRLRADRRLHMRRRELDPSQHQRAQLERDLANVRWIIDSSAEFIDQLAISERLVRGQPVSERPPARLGGAVGAEREANAPPGRVAALVPVDPERNGRGETRSLAEPFGGRPLLQATLERLGDCAALESIIVLVPRGATIEPLLNRAAIGRPVEIVETDGSPFPPEQVAIAAARAGAGSCWRGGISGMSIYDEVLCPRAMSAVLDERGLDAALLVAPDWPLLDPAHCTAVIDRYREHTDQHNLVFTQAPPGLGGAVISAGLMRELTDRNRLSTIGALLVYQPHAPQGDPISRDANVQIDHRIRNAMVRATVDAPRRRRRIDRLWPDGTVPSSAEIVAALGAPTPLDDGERPEEIVLELTTRRDATGAFHAGRGPVPPAADADPARVGPLLDRLGAAGDVALTLAGAGDPLRHPAFFEIVDRARAAGIRHVHVRTELRAGADAVERLAGGAIDAVSIDLHADRAATHHRMMGGEDFRDVIENIDRLAQARVPLAGPAGPAGLARPWIVPRLLRCPLTVTEIDSFFDRWQALLGACIIEGLPHRPGGELDRDIAPTFTPERVIIHELERRMTVLVDGSVPVSEADRLGRDTVGRVDETSVVELWSSLRAARRAALRVARPGHGGPVTWMP